MRRNMKAVKRDEFRRAIKKDRSTLPGTDAVLRHAVYLCGQHSAETAVAKNLRGGDRRAVNMQLHTAKRGDVDVDVYGSGKLLAGMMPAIQIRVA